MAPVTTPNQYQTDLKTFTYDELLRWAQIKSNNRFNEYAAYTAEHFGVGEEQAMLDFLQGSGKGFGISAQKMADGTYRGYMFNNPVDFPESNPLDSNAGSVSRATFREMVGQKFEDVQGTLTRHMTRFPASGGLGQQASYVLGSIGSAFGAVSAGTWLGKNIDSVLYNTNPDFWNSIGLESLNPATWSSLTNGSDSPFAGLLNMILGIDPNTGTAQMYMDQSALAYLAYAMNLAGVFAVGGYESYSQDYVDNWSTYFYYDGYTQPIRPAKQVGLERVYRGVPYENTYQIDNGFLFLYQLADGSYRIEAISNGPATLTETQLNKSTGTPTVYTRTLTATPLKGRDTNIYHYSASASGVIGPIGPVNVVSMSSTSGTNVASDVANFVYYGTTTETGGIDGISDQPDATLPNTSTWDTPENTLASLQQQYPDAFNNAMVWDNYNDDGTPAQTTWIPVPMPTATSATDTQPTTGTQTQTSVDISDLSEVLQQLITDIVQATQTQTDEQPLIPPQNPVDTGTGEPPVLVPPSGSASALWSVYHPTQAQLNQFGAWLWTDNVIEQFLRLMNNPMEGIITLHRVFITPVDSGQGTIVVGRLDSQVPTATVTQQYVYADCGTVSLNEQFANVFDYQPFTTVSLYLPFIGIVPLDVGDIMRSSIHIKYGVDVFTGACLAMVEVIRDSNTVNMYQYTGVAAVSYPLTGAQNSGLLSGLLGMAAGVGAIATGNIAGAGMIAAGAVSAAHVNMGRSGGFSGNAGAMGIKKPYLIISRPQTMVAQTFPNQQGYPTNYSATLGSYSGFVQCRAMHVESTCATRAEISEIQSLLSDGVMV